MYDIVGNKYIILFYIFVVFITWCYFLHADKIIDFTFMCGV